MKSVLVVGAACLVAGALSVGFAQAEEMFVGRWAATPSACGGFGGKDAKSATLVASGTSVSWYPGDCRIGKMYKLGQAVYIQAHCYGEAGGDVPITLDPKGDRMKVTWNRGKTEELQRCK
jgi:hypothetical protein